ncbi:MAG: ferric reductase-like transmembrane domain-containing protein, partial [Pseudomonadota bacterium]
MRLVGLLLVGSALALPLLWFAPLALRENPIALFSQYLGSAALIAMGISQLLATRLRPLQAVFGGLDQMYVLHKWLGLGAMAAVLLHDTIDAELGSAARETMLTELGETLGDLVGVGPELPLRGDQRD